MANNKTYLLKRFSDSKYKIGKTTDLESRKKSLESVFGPMELISVIDDDVEYEMHKIFREKSINNEWFSLSDEDLDLFKNYRYESFKSVAFKPINKLSKYLGFNVRVSEDGFISLSDLYSQYPNVPRIGIDTKIIQERLYYLLTDNNKISFDKDSFIYECNETSVISVLKGLGLYKTSGRAADKNVWVDSDIWLTVVITCIPELFKIIIWINTDYEVKKLFSRSL